MIPTPETGSLWTVRYHLHRRGDRPAGPGRDRSPSRPRGPRRSSATPPSPSIPTTRGTRRSSAAASGSRSSSATCRSSRTRSWTRRSAPARSRSRPPTTTTTTRPGSATASRCRRSSTTRRASRTRARAYDGLDRYEARAADPRGPRGARRPRGRQAPRDGHRPLPAQRRRRRAAAQDPVVRAARGRSPRPPSRRRAAARRAILPARFEKTWEHWMTDIRDWNVSRQLWWGHRIPAWYCPDGHVTVTSDPDGPDAVRGLRRPAPRADPGPRHLRHLVQLGPVAVLDARLARRRPTTSGATTRAPVMETGYDIIFFWVARMMMLGLHLTDAPPFQTVYLSGLIRDPYGQKMSKTKGNTVDPLGTIDELGADALAVRARPRHDARATTSGSGRRRSRTPGTSRTSCGTRRDTCSAPGRRRSPTDAERRLPDAAHLGAGRPLGAVARRRDDRGRGPRDGRLQLRRGHAAPVRRHLERVLRLGPRARQGAPRRRRPCPDAEREATWWALVEALDTYLRLLHPVMPFITERLWQALPHRATRPGAADRRPLARRRRRATRPPRREVGALVELVRAVRNARADAKAGARRRGCRSTCTWSPSSAMRSRRCGRRSSGSRAPVRCAGTSPARTSTGRPGAAGGLAVIAGPAEAIVGRRRRRPGRRGRRPSAGSRRSSRTPSGCSRPPVRGWRTTRSRRRRRRRSSRARAPARPSSPTRSSACATGSDAERATRSTGRREPRPARHRSTRALLRCAGPVQARVRRSRAPRIPEACRGDADQPAQAAAAPVARRAAGRGRRAGVPAQAVLRRQEQRGRPHQGGPARARRAAVHARGAREERRRGRRAAAARVRPGASRRSRGRPRRCSGSTRTTS